MRACEACKAEVPAGSAFCSQCGHRLGLLLSPKTASALRRSERKVVTILFADIKGSLALVAGQDPEMAGEILAIVVACMSEAVRRHGGFVNQVMGDGIMALFGAPIAMEGHAAQACLAALAMRLAVQDQVRPRVHVRVGLGSGEVVVRAVPGDVGLHYSAAGEAVHMASRMEQAADPDQVLLTEATRQHAAGLIEVRAVESVAIKGLDDPVPVFELLRMRVGRSGIAFDPAGRRIVGRDRELDLLRRARDRAAASEGQAIRLVGDAGAGKSRLVREFTGMHLPGEWQLCEAEALSHRRTSYGVVTELLARLFDILPDDPAAERREKVAAGLDLPSTELDLALVPLSALLGLQAEPRGWASFDAWERRERTIAATVRAFQRLSERQPVALVVEDAHWLDAESATSIQRLGATAAGRRQLSIITERAGEGIDAVAWTEARWQECPVRAFDENGTLAFLRSRLLPGPDVAALERKLIEHTRGNPLFLEECLQALVETGELVRSGEQFRQTAPIQVLRVPANLRGLLDARVDRLADIQKDVLQAASVVGSTVPLDLLRDAVDMNDVALADALGHLVEAGFLIAAEDGVPGGFPAGPVSRYAFRHGLIREAAYGGMLRRSRVRMHGAVLEALERRPGPAEPIVDLLANHAVLAETWPKASAYAKQAAIRAYDRYANPEAVHYYEQALAATQQLAAGPEQERMLLDLHLGVRWPLFRLGNVAALGPHLGEAVRLAALRDGHTDLAQALIMRSHVHWLRGEPEGALDDAAVAEVLATTHDDEDLAVRARFQRGLVGLSQSDVPGTLAHMAAVVDYMGPSPGTKRYGLDALLVVTALSYMARAHAAAGSLDAARRACDASLAMAAPMEQRHIKIFAHLADGVVALEEGRTGQALAALALADEYCRGADVRLLSPIVGQFLAQAHGAAGQAAVALPIARQAVEDAERMGFMALHPQRSAILAATLVATGQTEEAETVALGALALARRLGEAGAEAAASAVLGDVRARQRRNDAAAAYADGLRIAERLGLAPQARSIAARLAAINRGADAVSADAACAEVTCAEVTCAEVTCAEGGA